MPLVFTTLYTDALNGPDSTLNTTTGDGVLKSVTFADQPVLPLVVKNNILTPSDPTRFWGYATFVNPLPETGGRWMEFEIGKFMTGNWPAITDSTITFYLYTDPNFEYPTSYAGFEVYAGYFDVSQQMNVAVLDSTTDTYDTNPPPDNPQGYYGFKYWRPYMPQQGDVWRMAVIGTTWWLFLNGVEYGTGSFGVGALAGKAASLWLGEDNLYDAGLNDLGIINFKAGTVKLSAYSQPDSRTNPNSFRVSQDTMIYDVQTSSNPAVPPVDSRAAGAPQDCRVSSIVPGNSRAPGAYGPGE